MTLTQDDIAVIKMEVLDILNDELDEEVLREWGMQTNEWIEEAIQQGTTKPKDIAQEIIDDYYEYIWLNIL